MSSLKDLASLIMIPSLVKDGRLDTVKPLGNSIIHPDATGNNDGTDGSTPAEGNFTFSRGSNLAATRVDVNGLIEKGKENLLLQSNNFNDAIWTKKFSSVTSNQIGYDGSNDAWLIEKSAASGRVQQIQSGTGVHTFSVYAKAGTLNHMRLRAFSSSNPSCFFDFTDGSIHNNDGISATMTSVGGGWYRCSYSFVSSLIEVQIYPADSTSSVSGTSGSIYIQDSQLESGLVSTSVIETGASTAQSGILEDLPRLDYSGGASCPSLLLEPQRTNSVLNSEYFDAGLYNYVSGITRTANAAVSPEGLENAYLITEDSSNTTHRIGQASWGQSIENTSVSVFAKANGRRYIVLGNANMSPNMNTYFDLENGVVGIESAAIIDASIEPFGDGWYRCSISYLPNKGNTYPTIYLSPNNGGSVSYQGDGVSGVYLYGYQIEVGASYPTSYIPTYGVSQTRAKDQHDLSDITPFIGTTQGSWFLDWEIADSPTRDNSDTGFELSSDDNRDELNFSVDATGAMRMFVRTDNAYSQKYTTTNKSGKWCLVWNGTSLKLFQDGVEVYSDASVLVYNDYTTYEGIANLQYKVKQILLFPTALTDSECIALTTI